MTSLPEFNLASYEVGYRGVIIFFLKFIEHLNYDEVEVDITKVQDEIFFDGRQETDPNRTIGEKPSLYTFLSCVRAADTPGYFRLTSRPTAGLRNARSLEVALVCMFT